MYIDRVVPIFFVQQYKLTMIATQLLVVPKSIPMTSPASLLLNLLAVTSEPTPLKSETLFLEVNRDRRRPDPN